MVVLVAAVVVACVYACACACACVRVCACVFETHVFHEGRVVADHKVSEVVRLDLMWMKGRQAQW